MYFDRPRANRNQIQTSISVLGWLLAFCFAFSSQGFCLSNSAIVYYANDTSGAALESANYQAFIKILDKSGAASAIEIRDALVADAHESTKISYRDISALRRSAQRARIALIVFSNTLALEKRYLVYEPTSEEPISRYFAPGFYDDNSLLRLSPLSRSEYFESAMAAVTSELGPGSSKVALIVRSHGSNGMSLMPRLNADFTNSNESEILKVLDGVSHDDLQLPDVSLQGTTQVAFWNILSRITSKNRLSFPFVFLGSCESGPSTFEEAGAIPASVGVIVHSGQHGMSSEAISYEDLLAGGGSDRLSFDVLVSKLVGGLTAARQGLYQDSPLTVWRWPVIYRMSDYADFAKLGILVIVSLLLAYQGVRRFPVRIFRTSHSADYRPSVKSE